MPAALHPDLVAQIHSKRWYTLAEAADLLDVCEATVYAKVQTGELRSLRPGRTYQIYPGDLVDYLAGRLGAAAAGRR